MSELIEYSPEQLRIIQEEIEAQLAREGLSPVDKPLQEELEEAGLGGDSFEVAYETEQGIKKGLDDAIETENVFSSEIPLNKCGLPPCQRAKLESERTIQAKDPRLDK